MSKTKRLKLTQGKYAIVDADDYARLAQFHWCAFCENHKWRVARIAICEGKRRTIYLHRVILNAAQNAQMIHVNHNALDFRKSNLQIASISLQLQRGRIRKNKSSHFKGVSLNKKLQKWDARIKKQGKQFCLGLFDSEFDAAKAYDAKAVELYGELACKNFGNKFPEYPITHLHKRAALERRHGSRPNSGSFSRFKGVSWHKRIGKWMSRIVFNGHSYHIGYFESEIAAAKAYDTKVIELLGDDCYLNFPSNQKRKGA